MQICLLSLSQAQKQTIHSRLIMLILVDGVISTGYVDEIEATCNTNYTEWNNEINTNTIQNINSYF